MERVRTRRVLLLPEPGFLRADTPPGCGRCGRPSAAAAQLTFYSKFLFVRIFIYFLGLFNFCNKIFIFLVTG